MARSERAAVEKDRVWEVVEGLVGPIFPVSRRRKDWRVSGDGRLSLFLTYSKDDQRFYDVNKDDLAAWVSYPCAFVGFLMGSRRDVFIVPARQMALVMGRLRPAEKGNFKLHIIERSGGHQFRELPGFDLSQFHNAYWQLEE